MMPYKWATSASFAKAISTDSSMLYPPEIIHQITHPNRTLFRSIFSDYNPGHQIISARLGAEITAKIFGRHQFLVSPTYMH
jgi:hypothetical protein